MKQIPNVILREIEEVRNGQRDNAIIFWRGMPLLISRATDDDIERVHQGCVLVEVGE